MSEMERPKPRREKPNPPGKLEELSREELLDLLYDFAKRWLTLPEEPPGRPLNIPDFRLILAKFPSPAANKPDIRTISPVFPPPGAFAGGLVRISVLSPR